MPNGYTDWCFTTRADKLEELKALQEASSFIIVGLEIGEEGYEHYQGFLQLGVRRELTQMKRLARTTHLEPRKGTVDEAVDYCKKDGVWFDCGQLTYQGRRTDLEAFVEDAKANDARTMYSLHPGNMVRYGRAYNDIQTRFAESRQGAALYWLYGGPGVGKSTFPRSREPSLYDKCPTDWWWQGYNQEKAVVIDEITAAIPYATLLKLGDTGVHRLPTKGGDTVSAAERVFVTSNYPPDQVYVQDSRDPGRWGALLRRCRVYRCERVRSGVSSLRLVEWYEGRWVDTDHVKEFEVAGGQGQPPLL